MKKHKHQEVSFHFRDAVTLANIIPVLKESFPELETLFLEYKDDVLQTGEYDQAYFTYIFNPFLKQFLQSHEKHPNLLGKRLFHFLERMARSPEWPVVNILAVVILEHIDPGQLQVANKYMGPKTKDVLKDIQKHWRDLNAAQK